MLQCQFKNSENSDLRSGQISQVIGMQRDKLTDKERKNIIKRKKKKITIVMLKNGFKNLDLRCGQVIGTQCGKLMDQQKKIYQEKANKIIKTWK